MTGCGRDDLIGAEEAPGESECRGRDGSYPSASNLTSWIFLHLSRSPKAHLSEAGMSRSEIGRSMIKLLKIQQAIT